MKRLENAGGAVKRTKGLGRLQREVAASSIRSPMDMRRLFNLSWSDSLILKFPFLDYKFWQIWLGCNHIKYGKRKRVRL